MGTFTSTRFGEMNYDEEKVILFEQGLLGFSDKTRYIIQNIKGLDYPFKWLHSVEDPDLAFVIFDPSDWFPHYWPPVPASELASLGLASLEEAIVMLIVTVPPDPAQTTANFQSPLIINVNKRLGKQVVTGLPSYKTRQLIFSVKNLQEKTG